MSGSNSSWPEDFFEFPYTVNELLDDFVAIGDFTYMILLPSDAPEGLQQNLIAEAKTHSLGL